jgi:hypothetical protein
MALRGPPGGRRKERLRNRWPILMQNKWMDGANDRIGVCVWEWGWGCESEKDELNLKSV